MRFSLAVVAVLAGISASGWAQQNNTFKVKHSVTEKAPKSTVNAPLGKTARPAASAATGSAANDKDLRTLEHQTAKASAPSRPAGKKTPALKPVKEKPNPPINIGATGGKNAGSINQGSNPYKGRVKQKHARQ